MMRAGFPGEVGTTGPTFPQPAASRSRSATNSVTELTLISVPTPFMKFGGTRLRAVRAVPAAALAAVAAPQVVRRREDDVRALAVEVHALDGRPPLFQIPDVRHLKSGARRRRGR